MKIINEDFIYRDDENNIVRIHFYNDATNPKINTKYWNEYFRILKEFSKFKK